VRLAPHYRWAACPKCRQSATGSYGGSIGCVRCGWNETDKPLDQDDEFQELLRLKQRYFDRIRLPGSSRPDREVVPVALVMPALAPDDDDLSTHEGVGHEEDAA
jgi:hypothetical protein